MIFNNANSQSALVKIKLNEEKFLAAELAQWRCVVGRRQL